MGIEAVAATIVGIMVGWLARYFIFRFRAKAFTAKSFSTVASVLGGGVIADRFAQTPSDWACYSIGLFLGAVLWTILALRGQGRDILYYMVPRSKLANAPAEKASAEVSASSSIAPR